MNHLNALDTGKPLDKERGSVCRKACDYMPVAPYQQQSASGSPVVVLDTNVVLDWFWFEDPRVAPVARAIDGGRLRWLATAAMRAELEHVLNRLAASRSARSPAQVLTSFDSRALLANPAVVRQTMLCTDPDDQKFIDLAVTAGARWLFSRDRAVLRLARRARANGCSITVPERWLPLQSASET